MNYSAITPKRKVEIATNVLLLQNHGLDLEQIEIEDKQIYGLFDDIYAELGYSLNLQMELQKSEIYSTSDLIEFIFNTK